MNYLRFYNGGNVVKRLQTGGDMDRLAAASYRNLYQQYNNLTDEQVLAMKKINEESDNSEIETAEQLNTSLDQSKQNLQNLMQQEGITQEQLGQKVLDLKDSGVIKNVTQNAASQIIGGLGDKGGNLFGSGGSGMSNQAWGMVANAGVAAVNAVDNLVMGDKNFGAQSQAIDSVVHGASKALISSGNPYAMAAGAALEAGNFLTKAGGQTVQGFDVDIKSSGYGTIGHKDSSSSRDLGALIGLGGLNVAATERKLKKRNEEAQMALKAADIADTIKFEQEARMNSVDDVIQQNEIALQGGIDTSLLAAKHGARLERIQKQRKRVNPDPEEVVIHENVIIETPEEVIIDAPVVKAQNGAKLEHIEVSEEQNVIPSGAMHKNKNHIDLEITEKGIPVITVEDDSVETFEEIKDQEDTLVQHAEVEEAEIIFNKELTIFVENLRKQWHEKDNKDDSICLEAGMRLAKEIIENTEDNTDVTEKSMEAVDNEEN